MATMTSEPRMLLQGDALRIGFHGVGKAAYPEDIVAAAVLRAVAGHLRVDLNTQGIFWGDYCFFAGITGEAFRFMEFMNLSPHQRAKALVQRYGQMSTAQMYRHAFEAAGLDAQLYLKPDLPEEAVLRQRIIESLGDRQTPVIGLGIFGPPEPFLITGYDEDGEVLIGWSHFQGEKKDDANISFEPTGQFRLKNWYRVIDGVILAARVGQKTSSKQTYRSAIERGLRELRSTADSGSIGTAAMEKWATHLEREADFAGLSEEQWTKAQSDHGVTAGDLAERRALAASFLELAARVFHEAKDDLAGAQYAFQGAHDCVYEIWEVVAKTGPFDPDISKFKDPARRRDMARLVRRLVQFDQRGAAHLERTIAIIDGKQPGAAIPADPVLDGTVALKKAPAPQPIHPHIWAPENIAIPNAMGMLRVFLGEPFGELNDAERANRKLDYALWMGFSGAAFGMLWDGPERANLPLAFDVLGYDYELWMSAKLAGETGLPCRKWGWDDNLRRRIFWNLRDPRLPVLLFDCGQWPNWYLVTKAENWGGFYGYGGNNGEGYRPNEPLDDPKNPLRKIDLMPWMKGRETWTLNVLQKRSAPKPPMEELYRRAVQWGAKKMNQQRMKLLNVDGEEFISSHPYQDWAKMMAADALFPTDMPDILKKRREYLEGHEVELAERRFYGAAFLDLAAIRLNRPQLNEAAGRFRAINRLMGLIWAQIGGMDAPGAHLKYADKAARRAIAGLLLEIEQEDAAAAALLAR